ncbi:YciI family protein [Herbidospora mongoliensis]|uniref:YciI family protein n=1 Tax=Herbidospora mongoliensis TaxID=688067 RepID=UPI00157C2195|nr:YciI family protein [Herbidospora mongoliensis]
MLLIHGSGDGCTPQEWMDYDKSVREAGIFVSGESLAEQALATSVTIGESGERVVTDGPYAEAREVLGGFYVIDVPDLDAATDWAARCPGARDGGSMVVRPVVEYA